MSGPLPRPVRPRGSESLASRAAHLAGSETPNLCETRPVQRVVVLDRSELRAQKYEVMYLDE